MSPGSLEVGLWLSLENSCSLIKDFGLSPSDVTFLGPCVWEESDTGEELIKKYLLNFYQLHTAVKSRLRNAPCPVKTIRQKNIPCSPIAGQQQGQGLPWCFSFLTSPNRLNGIEMIPGRNDSTKDQTDGNSEQTGPQVEFSSRGKDRSEDEDSSVV